MKPPLIVIAGPTASGKSALARAVSRRAPSIIINADASQVYRDLRTVSARPSLAEEAEVPHRLYGHMDGAIACSAAHWAGQAASEIAQAHAQGALPILVGGTGLYIRTLLDGIAPVPEIDPAVREEVRALPVEVAHTALLREDPEAAQRLNAGDTTRVARALEVVRSTGRTLKDWQGAKTGGIVANVRIATAILLPPRDWLYERCDLRFEEMVNSGAIEEVEALLGRNLDPALPVMRAIGVPEIIALLQGEMSRESAIFQAQTATRQFAKRQSTWFRNQPIPESEPLNAQLNDSNVNEFAIKLYERALTT